MGVLSRKKPIKSLGQRKLVVIYGQSNTGKTVLSSTFPKPMLYLSIGDEGSNPIANVDGIDTIKIETALELKQVFDELLKDKNEYQSVVVDTFSLYVNVWTHDYIISKGKRMTQQDWGNLKTDTEEVIRLAHKLAADKWVILNCHEIADSFEGLEEEITPDIRPNVSKGVRTYLEGMSNLGIHTSRMSKTVEKDGKEKTLVKYAAHLGANEYYWTKVQVPPGINIPSVIINPSYEKLMTILNGGK
jgi:hypothetical protein